MDTKCAGPCPFTSGRLEQFGAPGQRGSLGAVEVSHPQGELLLSGL